MLSGDEGGDINLYKILTVDSLSGHGSVIDSLMILSTWSCLVPTRAIADLVEVKATHAYVVQIGSGMNGRTKIYQIVVQNRSVRPKYIISGAKNDSDKGSHVYERHTLEDLILSTKQLEADPKFNRQKEKISPLEELDILDEVQLARKAQQTNFKSYEMDYMDIYLSIVELCSVNSDKYEITCCTLTYDYHKMLQRASFKSSCYLYVGTASGLILRYSFD